MVVLMFLLWIILNGRITVQITVIGLIGTAVIYAFISKFMGITIKKELRFIGKTGLLLRYCAVLMVEIVKANFAVIRIIWDRGRKVEQTIYTFEVDLKREISKTILANSITLTPGTITVDLVGNVFEVHCLDVSLIEGIEDGKFMQLLKKMEA